jgi:hypothetical protein
MEQSMTSERLRVARRSAQEIRDIIADYKASGQSRVAYWKSHAINEGTFSTWVRRHAGNKEPVGFIPVRVAGDGPAEEAGLFAECRGVKLYQRVEASYLKELLREC